MLIKSIPDRLVATNYLFCCDHKSLTAEYVPKSAGTNLILEQAPESRGTIMSISTIFITLGLGLGSALGGAALVLSGWTGLILTFAALQLIAVAIYFFLTEDPCITKETDLKKPRLSYRMQERESQNLTLQKKWV